MIGLRYCKKKGIIVLTHIRNTNINTTIYNSIETWKHNVKIYSCHKMGCFPILKLCYNWTVHFRAYWVGKQQTSWVIAHWWFSVSLWWICITFVWPKDSLKLTAPFSQSEPHLHFASIRLCLALLFIISMYF